MLAHETITATRSGARVSRNPRNAPAAASPLCGQPAVTFTTRCAGCDSGGDSDGGGGGGGGGGAEAPPLGCFDGDALVLMADGVSERRISDLAIGDRVASVGPGGALSSTPVLAFAHRDARESDVDLLEVHVVVPGDRPRGAKASIVRLTPNHLVPVLMDGSAERTVVLPARRLRTGHRGLTLVRGAAEAGRVADVVHAASAARLVAPMTAANTIVVHGVVASCATEGMFFASAEGRRAMPFALATRDALLEALLLPVHALLLSLPVLRAWARSLLTLLESGGAARAWAAHWVAGGAWRGCAARDCVRPPSRPVL